MKVLVVACIAVCLLASIALSTKPKRNPRFGCYDSSGNWHQNTCWDESTSFTLARKNDSKACQKLIQGEVDCYNKLHPICRESCDSSWFKYVTDVTQVEIFNNHICSNLEDYYEMLNCWIVRTTCKYDLNEPDFCQRDLNLYACLQGNYRGCRQELQDLNKELNTISLHPDCKLQLERQGGFQ